MTFLPQIKRGWVNFSLEEPYQLSAYYSHYVNADRMWTPQDKLAELDREIPRLRVRSSTLADP
jgi:insulysin